MPPISMVHFSSASFQSQHFELRRGRDTRVNEPQPLLAQGSGSLFGRIQNDTRQPEIVKIHRGNSEIGGIRKIFQQGMFLNDP
jgi:hypothetical protein